MNKQPLWSDDQYLDNILDSIEDCDYSVDGLVDMISNLFNDIQCLKEDLSDSKSKTLLDLLSHFKKLHDQRNKSLAASGESKYCKPFGEISVSDIKAYALSGSGFEEF